MIQSFIQHVAPYLVLARCIGVHIGQCAFQVGSALELSPPNAKGTCPRAGPTMGAVLGAAARYGMEAPANS